MTWIDTLKAVGTVVGPLLGGGGVWAFMATRAKLRAPKTSSPSQIAESQAALVSAVNEQTKTILAENARLRRESSRERRQLKQRADRQDKQISALTKAVNEATAKHQDCETNLGGSWNNGGNAVRASGHIASIF